MMSKINEGIDETKKRRKEQGIEGTERHKGQNLTSRKSFEYKGIEVCIDVKTNNSESEDTGQ